MGKCSDRRVTLRLSRSIWEINANFVVARYSLRLTIIVKSYCECITLGLVNSHLRFVEILSPKHIHVFFIQYVKAGTIYYTQNMNAADRQLTPTIKNIVEFSENLYIWRLICKMRWFIIMNVYNNILLSRTMDDRC